MLRNLQCLLLAANPLGPGTSGEIVTLLKATLRGKRELRLLSLISACALDPKVLRGLWGVPDLRGFHDGLVFYRALQHYGPRVE